MILYVKNKNKTYKVLRFRFRKNQIRINLQTNTVLH